MERKDSLAAAAPRDDGKIPPVTYKDQMRNAYQEPDYSTPPLSSVASTSAVVKAEPLFNVNLNDGLPTGTQSLQHLPIADAVHISPSILQSETQEERDRRIQQLERQVDDLRHAETKKRKLALLYAFVVIVLLGIAAAAGTCGAGKCRRRSDSNQSSSSAPTRLVWQQVGEDMKGFNDEQFSFSSGSGGLFGSAVSLSNDGRVLAVGFGEYQTWFSRARTTRVLAALGSWSLANLYDCSGENECVEIGTIERDHANYDRQSSAYLSMSVAGDGSRIAVAYDNVLKVYATSNTAAPIGVNSTLRQSTNDSINQTVVALSDAGDVLAVLEKGNGGLVSVYEYQEEGDDWQRLGQTITFRDNEMNATASTSLALSSTGTVVAIGANFVGNCSHIEGLDYAGLNVKVFGYAPTTFGSWTQIGLDIEGEEVYESLFSDQSVALSSDGNIIAIGSSLKDSSHCDNGFVYAPRKDTGHVRVFRLSEDKDNWVPMGQALAGREGAGDKFGVSVSLSDNGMTLVIGSSHDGEGGLRSGKTQVYKYDDGADVWNQLGQDVVGNAGDSSGTSVAISGDGRTVAVGAPYSALLGTETGTARIFRLGSSSS